MHDDGNVIVRRVEDTVPETRGEIEKRVFFTPGQGADHVRFTMYRAKPGLKSDLHVNPGDDCSYIIQGRLILHSAGKTWELKAGDAFIIRRAEPHKAEVVGDEDLILIASHCEFCPLFQAWDAQQAVPQGPARVLEPA
jgi:quercetin dioxygenase-like cupin family protein